MEGIKNNIDITVDFQYILLRSIENNIYSTLRNSIKSNCYQYKRLWWYKDVRCDHIKLAYNTYYCGNVFIGKTYMISRNRLHGEKLLTVKRYARN